MKYIIGLCLLLLCSMTFAAILNVPAYNAYSLNCYKKYRGYVQITEVDGVLIGQCFNHSNNK